VVVGAAKEISLLRTDFLLNYKLIILLSTVYNMPKRFDKISFLTQAFRRQRNNNNHHNNSKLLCSIQSTQLHTNLTQRILYNSNHNNAAIIISLKAFAHTYTRDHGCHCY